MNSGSERNKLTLHEAQRHLDRCHHEERLAWLSQDAPTWADGSPVSASDKLQMSTASRECLRLINDHGMSTNSANPPPINAAHQPANSQEVK